MTLVGLIAIVVLIALLIYIAQQMAPPWPFVLYAIAALLVVLAILLVLGIGGRTIAIGATGGGYSKVFVKGAATVRESKREFSHF